MERANGQADEPDEDREPAQQVEERGRTGTGAHLGRHANGAAGIAGDRLGTQDQVAIAERAREEKLARFRRDAANRKDVRATRERELVEAAERVETMLAPFREYERHMKSMLPTLDAGQPLSEAQLLIAIQREAIFLLSSPAPVKVRMEALRILVKHHDLELSRRVIEPEPEVEPEEVPVEELLPDDEELDLPEF